MKKDTLDTVNALHERFNRIVKMAGQLEKMPRSYGTDELLTSSEIHLIEMIGDYEETLGVTDLAKIVGVTKGAVSQKLKKLEAKGLAFKEEDPQNSSRVLVRLTSKGKAAFFAHKHWHEQLDGGYRNYFLSLEKEKLDFLFEFTLRVEDFLNRLLAAKP